MAAIVIVLLGIFVIGVVAGTIAVVCLGVRREDNGPFLPEEGPDRLTRGARRLTGLYVRQAPPAPWEATEPLLAYRAPADRDLLV
jgi:hypothetical protein